MSNGWQDDSIQFKEDETESRTGTEACILVTILESKEREKGSNNDSESSLETEMEAGMEAETEVKMAFSVIGAVFSVRRTGDSVFLWEGGITVFNGIMGMDRLCNEGLGQDNEGGTQRQGQSRGGWYNPAGCLTAQLLKIWVWMPVSLLFFGRYCDTLLCVGICDGKVLITISEVLGDALGEGIERAAEEDVVWGIWYDLHLKIYVNIVKCEADVVEAAVCFGDSGVGGLHLQCAFYL
jgi:hypothetical protein